jgi:cytoskeletal protein CcmA (bactofilin family)
MAKFNEIETKPNSINQIGAGTIINGDVNSNGDIRIDGVLTGNLTTKGKVVIGETGSLKGEVTCGNAVIEGKTEGKLSVNDLLTLKSTAKVIGDIIINKLAIEPGCKFSGNCKMSGDNTTTPFEAEKLKPAEEPKKHF